MVGTHGSVIFLHFFSGTMIYTGFIIVASLNISYHDF